MVGGGGRRIPTRGGGAEGPGAGVGWALYEVVVWPGGSAGIGGGMREAAEVEAGGGA